MSWGSLLVRAAGVVFIAWPLVQNLITYMPRFSRARLEGIFPMIIGTQLLIAGMMIDRPGTRARHWWLLVLFTAGIVICWVTGQLLAAIIVFLLQLPFLLSQDNEWRRTPRH